MPMVSVAAGHYESEAVGDIRKFCENVYSEPNPNDPQRPIRHIQRFGSVDRDTGNVLASVPRGLTQESGFADSKILVVDGATVRTVTTGGTWGALTGSLSGSDRVRTAFSEVEGAFLSGGQIYTSDGSSVAAVTDPDFATHLSNHSETEFKDILSIGQRLLFIYGKRLGWSDTLNFGSTSTTYFVTTEDSPDANVGLAKLNSRVYVFGEKTIQIYAQTGQEGAAAFRPQVGSTIERGCVSKHTIQQLDNTLFFVGENSEPYRLNGLIPQSLVEEDLWVTNNIEKEDPEDLVTATIEGNGHSFYIISGRLGCYVYSVRMRRWFRWRTYEEATWEWAQIVTVGGDHFAISRLYNSFVELDRAFESDNKASVETFGTEIVTKVSAHLPVLGGDQEIPEIRFDGTVGRGSGADINDDAYITLFISDNGGITFDSGRTRSRGKQGEYDTHVAWDMNGRAEPPQTILLFQSNDPGFLNGIAVGED